jgi:tRNA 2-thiocytidine biosynthesis protein TtcA
VKSTSLTLLPLNHVVSFTEADQTSPPDRTTSYSRLLESVYGFIVRDQLLPPGQVGVAISGGADSLTLFRLLWDLADRLEITPVPIFVSQYDANQDGPSRTGVLEHLLRNLFGARLVTIPAETTGPAEQALRHGYAPCRVCAPIRSLAIATVAHELGLTRVALGHHMTDVYATLLMNMLHRADVQTMRPRVRRRGQRVTIVRPLYFQTEAVVKLHTPYEKVGVFDCGMCSTHATERTRISTFVNESFAQHPPTIELTRRLLAELLARPPERSGRAPLPSGDYG